MYVKLNFDFAPCASDIWYKFSEPYRKISVKWWNHS